MTREFQPCAYLMANKRNGTIYAGVTSDLVKRVWQHREGLGGFTTRYGCKQLVWFEQHSTMEHAILREIGELLAEALEIAECVFVDKANEAK